MIVINKKRITFIFFMLFLSIISAFVNNKKVNIVPTSSLPITNKVIILDAGHGKPDEGVLWLPKTQATNLLQEKLLTNGIKTLYN